MDAARMKELLPTSLYEQDAEDAAGRLRDGIAALDLITRNPWDANADKARNAVAWIADKLDLDVETLIDTLDQCRRDREAAL